MNVLPRRCECVWCGEVFYSDMYYKFGTCSACLVTKIVIPAPKLAELLKEAEKEASKQLKLSKKNRS